MLKIPSKTSDRKFLIFSFSEFSLKCKLNPGSYQYKFIVDEKWVSEELLPRQSDGMGAFNNVVEIK